MDYEECDEVANSLVNVPVFDTLFETTEYVRALMPDESHTVVNNVAWQLFCKGRRG